MKNLLRLALLGLAIASAASILSNCGDDVTKLQVQALKDKQPGV